MSRSQSQNYGTRYLQRHRSRSESNSLEDVHADILMLGNNNDHNNDNSMHHSASSSRIQSSGFWWPLSRKDRRMSVDEEGVYLNLTPSLHCTSRKGSRSSAVTSLVATMVGGGVLSLPYALSRAGILLGLFYLFLSGILSAFSIRLLFSCARRSGATTYEEVALKAFGAPAKYFTIMLVVLLTFLAMVAYMILARDLATPLIESYIIDKKMVQSERDIAAIVLLCLISPLCFATSMHSLRFTSMASLFALLLLSIAILYKCIQHSKERTILSKNLKYVSTNAHDSLYAFPFMQVAFMCHFNVLPVHTGLRLPTRKRLDCVVSSTIFLSCMVYTLVALSGYLFAYDHECSVKSSSTCVSGVADNILNVFDVKDPFIDLGRFGLLAALLLSLPLLVLPCRESLLRLVKATCAYSKSIPSYRNSATDVSVGVIERIDAEDENGHEYSELGNGEQEQDGGQAGERVYTVSSQQSASQYSYSGIDTPGGLEALPIIDTAESPEFRTAQLRRMQRRVSRMNDAAPVSVEISESVSNFSHVVSTVSLLTMAALIMISVPGVGFVWNITGSTVSILLAFILPAAFYIKIRSTRKATDARICLAWTLLILSCITCVLCTYESINSLY